MGGERKDREEMQGGKGKGNVRRKDTQEKGGEKEIGQGQ